MRLFQLLPAIGPRVAVRCVGCDQTGPLAEMLADLDGRAFVDYWHLECAEERLSQ